jgi:integrase
VRLQPLTGARLGEVLKAERADFDLARGVWTKPSHHTKQKKREHLPLSAEAHALVSTVLADSNPACPYLSPGDAPGKALQDIKKFWGSAMRLAGITGYRRHDNRHTYASHLVSSGLSLEIVGCLLGHTNPSTTKRYAHVADCCEQRPSGSAQSSQAMGPERAPLNSSPLAIVPLPSLNT